MKFEVINIEDISEKLNQNKNVHSYSIYETPNSSIHMHILFELDEEECYQELKNIGIEMVSSFRGIKGFDIDPYLNEMELLIR